ncbi:MAG: hypothetical protein Q9174_005091 [Haloplaca sp. 1 TL-2023]
MHVSTLFFPLASLLLAPSLAAPTAQAVEASGGQDPQSGENQGQANPNSEPATIGDGAVAGTASTNSAPPEDPLTARCLDIAGQGLDPACWNALSVTTYLESNAPANCAQTSPDFPWAQCFVSRNGANWDFTKLRLERETYPPPELPTSNPGATGNSAANPVQALYGDWSIWFLHHYLYRVATEIQAGTITPAEGQTTVDAKRLRDVLGSDQAPGAADPQLRELGERVAFIISALDTATGVQTDGMDFLQRVLDDAVAGPGNGPNGAFQRLSKDGGLIHSPL